MSECGCNFHRYKRSNRNEKGSFPYHVLLGNRDGSAQCGMLLSHSNEDTIIYTKDEKRNAWARYSRSHLIEMGLDVENSVVLAQNKSMFLHQMEKKSAESSYQDVIPPRYISFMYKCKQGHEEEAKLVQKSAPIEDQRETVPDNNVRIEENGIYAFLMRHDREATIERDPKLVRITGRRGSVGGTRLPLYECEFEIPEEGLTIELLSYAWLVSNPSYKKIVDDYKRSAMLESEAAL